MNLSGLGAVLVALPISILANNFLGAALAGVDHKQTFEKDKLKAGLIKGALVYVGILLFVITSNLLGGLKIDILGDIYTLSDAVYVIIFGSIVNYATDGIIKLTKILNYRGGNEND